MSRACFRFILSFLATPWDCYLMHRVWRLSVGALQAGILSMPEVTADCPVMTSRDSSDVVSPRKRQHVTRRIMATVSRSCAILCFVGSGAALAQTSDAVIAEVNGTKIHEGEVIFAQEDIGMDLRGVEPQQKRKYYVDYLGDVILLANVAKK